MIEWTFKPEDVARIRFAFSPLWEAVHSLIVLRAPSAHALHVPWVRSALLKVVELDLSELFALVPVRGPTADRHLARRPSHRCRPVRVLRRTLRRRVTAGARGDALAERAQAHRALPADARLPSPRHPHPLGNRSTARPGRARRPHRAHPCRPAHQPRAASVNHAPRPPPLAHPRRGQPT